MSQRSQERLAWAISAEITRAACRPQCLLPSTLFHAFLKQFCSATPRTHPGTRPASLDSAITSQRLPVFSLPLWWEITQLSGWLALPRSLPASSHQSRSFGILLLLSLQPLHFKRYLSSQRLHRLLGTGGVSGRGEEEDGVRSSLPVYMRGLCGSHLFFNRAHWKLERPEPSSGPGFTTFSRLRVPVPLGDRADYSNCGTVYNKS